MQQTSVNLDSSAGRTQAMTAERHKKILALLSKRQADFTLMFEQVHKPHNVSAIFRTADAIGVHKVHAVLTGKYANGSLSFRRSTSMGSQTWVDTQYHNSTIDAFNELKAQNMQVLVTHLDNKAVDFRSIDYTKPTAIILGQEKTGATEQAIQLADQSIMIPMLGMVQSLNVSVAAAIIMYEAQRQRQNAGMYEKIRLSTAEIQRKLFEGGFPVLFKECQRRNLPYPFINEKGEIEASKSWWQKLQYSSLEK